MIIRMKYLNTRIDNVSDQTVVLKWRWLTAVLWLNVTGNLFPFKLRACSSIVCLFDSTAFVWNQHVVKNTWTLNVIVTMSWSNNWLVSKYLLRNLLNNRNICAHAFRACLCHGPAGHLDKPHVKNLTSGETNRMSKEVVLALNLGHTKPKGGAQEFIL